MDKKVVKDYTKQVQDIIKEKYGVHVTRLDLLKIMTPPFKNIAYALLKGDGVSLSGFLTIKDTGLRRVRYLLKKKGKG